MEMSVFGIDLGKSIFHLFELRHGRVQTRSLCWRGMMAQGHVVRLMPAMSLKPFLKSNENDDLDEEAITEAVQ